MNPDPWIDPDYFARMRKERERASAEHRELIARLDELIRELNAELDAEPEATRMQIVAARPSPARYTQWEAMGVRAPWYVRLTNYLNRSQP